MKKLNLSLLLLFAAVAAFAQKDIPSFGKISDEELKMSACAFEPEAEAMYLYDGSWVSYVPSTEIAYVTSNERVIRIKVFNEKGFGHADVKIPYYDDKRYESVDHLSACTYNMDENGKIIKSPVDKKSFYREKLNNYYSAVSFTFPEVKAGSVLEYRYKLTRKSFSSIDPWYFQADLPVGISHFELQIPEYFNFTRQVLCGLNLDRKEDKIGDQFTYDYTMRDIPSLKTEPFMGARKDYLQRVEFQLSSINVPQRIPIMVMSSWEKITEDLLKDENFGAQLRKNIRVPENIKDSLKGASTQFERIRILHDFVRLGFEWNNVVDIFSDGVKNVMEKRTGSNADLNMLLLNLLRDQNIECYPLLVSTRDHGKIFQAYPFMSQFNKVIVLCKGEENYYVINAADKYNPTHLIPYEVMGTDGYIVDNKVNGFVTLWNPDQKKSTYINIMGALEKGDSLKGKALVRSTGYARNPVVKKFKEESGALTAQYASNGDIKLNIDSLWVENLNQDSFALNQHFRFSCPVNQSGEYNFFTVNLFSGLDKNPFESEKRFTDVNFGCNQSYLITGSVRLPSNALLEELPKNISMITPDTSIVFRRMFQLTENMLQFRINLDFRQPVYYLQEYPDFREFYKQLFSLLNEQIVFKKNEDTDDTE